MAVDQKGARRGQRLMALDIVGAEAGQTFRLALLRRGEQTNRGQSHGGGAVLQPGKLLAAALAPVVQRLGWALRNVKRPVARL